jgi:type IV secretion system protein VirB4
VRGDGAIWQGRQGAAAAQTHFESAYYLTLLYMPPGDQVARAEQALLERAEPDQGRDWRQDLAAFNAETERVRDLLTGFMPEVQALDDAETLTYLHGTISTHRHRVEAPETPLYLDAILADTPLSGGIEPMLGDQHLRSVTVLGFPNLTRPGILDALNHQDFAYRWTTRFIALDKTEATKTLTKLRRQWFNKRKSISALLREVMYILSIPMKGGGLPMRRAEAVPDGRLVLRRSMEDLAISFQRNWPYVFLTMHHIRVCEGNTPCTIS